VLHLLQEQNLDDSQFSIYNYCVLEHTRRYVGQNSALGRQDQVRSKELSEKGCEWPSKQPVFKRVEHELAAAVSVSRIMLALYY